MSVNETYITYSLLAIVVVGGYAHDSKVPIDSSKKLGYNIKICSKKCNEFLSKTKRTYGILQVILTAAGLQNIGIMVELLM